MDQNLKRSIARLSLDWENFEKDLDLDFTLKEMAARITELRLVSGLSHLEYRWSQPFFIKQFKSRKHFSPFLYTVYYPQTLTFLGQSDALFS